MNLLMGLLRIILGKVIQAIKDGVFLKGNAGFDALDRAIHYGRTNVARILIDKGVLVRPYSLFAINLSFENINGWNLSAVYFNNAKFIYTDLGAKKLKDTEFSGVDFTN